ncbi:unnamed protein product, partial [Phaeothamnion confervicola]
MSVLSPTAKQLVIISLLAKDGLITLNGGAFLKELALRNDARLRLLLDRFETARDSTSFVDDVNVLIDAEGSAVYHELYADCSLEAAKNLSKAEREAKQLTSCKSLIYGEVDYFSFARVLRRIRAPPGAVFYDLGSGTGRALFVARFTQDFSRCVGIELLESLHGAALGVCERFNRHFRGYLSTTRPQHAAVYHGSFLDVDWRDGDVVFANSTCFGEELMDGIRKRAALLKPGSIFISFTKDLQAPGTFEILDKKRYRMSWGPATVYVHRRLGLDGRPVSDVGLTLDDEEVAPVRSPSPSPSAVAAAAAAAAAAASATASSAREKERKAGRRARAGMAMATGAGAA